jgi:hypothetical protein
LAVEWRYRVSRSRAALLYLKEKLTFTIGKNAK